MEKKNNDKTKKIIIALISLILIILIIIMIIMNLNKKYEISFNTNGGTKLDALEINKDGTITKPEDPVRDGYKFVGWYYGNELFDFNTKIDKNITLEARWEEISESFELETNTMSLVIGSEETIKVKSDDSLDFEYISSDSSIASVDKTGKVKALKEGTATVTVKNKDGQTATVTITVTKNEIKVSSVSINGKSEVTVGSSVTLSALINPSDATNKNVSWSSSNKSVATVDSNGVVKGLKEGTVTITVKTEDGSKTATLKIKVVAKTTTTKTTTKTPTKETTTTTTTKTTTTTTSTTKTTTTSTTKKADKYVVTLTPIKQAGTGAVAQYEVSVTMNNGAVEYKSFKIDGVITYFYGDGFIEASALEGKRLTNATIYFRDGSHVEADVIVK